MGSGSGSDLISRKFTTSSSSTSGLKTLSLGLDNVYDQNSQRTVSRKQEFVGYFDKSGQIVSASGTSSKSESTVIQNLIGDYFLTPSMKEETQFDITQMNYSRGGYSSKSQISGQKSETTQFDQDNNPVINESGNWKNTTAMGGAVPAESNSATEFVKNSNYSGQYSTLSGNSVTKGNLDYLTGLDFDFVNTTSVNLRQDGLVDANDSIVQTFTQNFLTDVNGDGILDLRTLSSTFEMQGGENSGNVSNINASKEIISLGIGDGNFGEAKTLNETSSIAFSNINESFFLSAFNDLSNPMSTGIGAG